MKALAVELSKRSRAGAASRITRRPGRCENGGVRREQPPECRGCSHPPAQLLIERGPGSHDGVHWAAAVGPLFCTLGCDTRFF